MRAVTPDRRTTERLSSCSAHCCSWRLRASQAVGTLVVRRPFAPPPLFIDVATFGANAEACTKYLANGRANRGHRPPGLPRVGNPRARRSKHQVIGPARLGGGPTKRPPTASTPPMVSGTPSHPHA